MNWYAFAVRFCDHQWARTSGSNRKNVAKALTTTTIALLRARPSGFESIDIRRALREYAFNTRRREDAPPEMAVILKWVERNALSMASWEDPVKVEEVLRALSTLLDGSAAAASSIKRNGES
ncbi:hypothetical protein ACWD6R_30115 [Streptomyces sp. NPDC005151]